MTPPAPQAATARASISENTKANKIIVAAGFLLPSLERGRALDARILREAMTAAFGQGDQDGAWLWKDAYEASEAAALLFLRKYGPGMLRKAAAPVRYLAMLERIAALLPLMILQARTSRRSMPALPTRSPLSSPRRSTAASMPGTAPASIQG